MEFEFIIESAPQEALLKFLNTISNTNRDAKKGKKISKQIGWNAFNQSDLTTLRQIKPLPTNQTTFHFFNNTIRIHFSLKGAPNGIPKYFKGIEETLQLRIQAKPSTSSTAPTWTNSNLVNLIFKPETSSKHKKRQRK
jgi:hypothetical protein